MAWERDHSEGPRADDEVSETCEQLVERRRAGTLALIGLINERGRREDDEVVVPLSPVLVGLAVDAADDVPSS